MGKTVWKWALRIFGYALLFLATLGLGIYFGNIAIYGCAIAYIGLLIFVDSLLLDVLDDPVEGDDAKDEKHMKE